MPVAFNCSVLPAATDPLAGVTAIPVRVAGAEAMVNCMVVVAMTEPPLAVMVIG